MPSLDYLYIERLERENDRLREQVDDLRKALERLTSAGEDVPHSPELGASLVHARFTLNQTAGMKDGR